MVSISVRGSICEINILGFHKILALKSKIQIKKQNIRSVMLAEKGLRSPLLKMPGIRIPGLITAGTYIGNGEKEFWDKGNKNQAIEIELENEKYTKLVVDVADPEAAIKLLKA